MTVQTLVANADICNAADQIIDGKQNSILRLSNDEDVAKYLAAEAYGLQAGSYP